MKNFSIQRFWRYALLHLASNKRGYINMIMVYSAAIVLIELVNLYFDGNKTLNISSCIFGYIICLYILCSRAFNSYHKPLSSPRMMMLPASKCEKFSAIILIELIATPLTLIVILWAITNTIIITCDTAHIDLISFNDLALYSNAAYNPAYYPEYTPTAPYTYIVFSLAYFLWFAVMFRRNQFWIACGVNILILIAFIITIEYYVKNYTPNLSFNISDDTLGIITKVSFLLIFVLLYLTWRRFKKLKIKR